MTVMIKRDADGRMAETFLDLLGMSPVRNEKSRAGVTEIMEPQSAPQVRPPYRGQEIASIKVLSERVTLGQVNRYPFDWYLARCSETI
jgi:hypothetical protein